jgi:hypothetical protein
MTIFFGTFSSLWLTCHCVVVKLGGLAWFFYLTTVLTCRNVIYFRPCIGTKVNPVLKKHIVSLSNKLSFGGDPQEFHESLVHWILLPDLFLPPICVGIYPLLLLLIKWDVSQVLFIYIFFDDGPFWLAHYEKKKQGVCHIIALPFTKKSIWRQKKNYGNSNISPFKNIIFKKSSKQNQNPSRDYISITNFKFQTEA